jgi:signal transduction histidine kinase
MNDGNDQSNESGEAATAVQRERRDTGTQITFSLRVVSFMALSLVALIPVVALAGWVYSRALDDQLASVSDKHLVIAKNLGAALERYVVDIGNGFDLAARALINGDKIDGLEAFMANMNFVHLCIAALPSGRIFNEVLSRDLKCPHEVPRARLKVFTDLLEKDRVVFSPVMPNPLKEPTIYLLKQYGDKLVIGAIATDYIVERGTAIAFGKRGHAAIVDQTGSLLAHPLPAWRDSMKNIAKLAPVKKMLARETGSIVFFSPALKADMVAGYTFVPRTGWGVMIPQPFEELRDEAGRIRSQAIAIAIAGLIIALVIGWALSRYLAQSLSKVVVAARKMARGDLEARVDLDSGLLPKELRTLGGAFDAMAENVDAANSRLSSALVQAEAGAAAKTAFLTTISHEIRTPMNGVLGVSQMLKETELNAEQREMADIIHDSTRSLLGIVSDVLDMSKIEAGEHEFVLETVAAADLVKDISRELGSIARAKGVEMGLTLTDQDPYWIVSDRTGLRQILVNLIGNAIKFTDRGNVHVKVSPHRGPNDEKWLKIDIHDTGVGIPSETIEQLFMPFSQADATTTRRFGGTGLGLSISKRLANLLGGDIHVTSVAGTGSTFSLLHPIGDVETASLTEAAAAAAATAPVTDGAMGVDLDQGAKKARDILVAEDNVSNQWLLRRWLECPPSAPLRQIKGFTQGRILVSSQ